MNNGINRAISIFCFLFMLGTVFAGVFGNTRATDIDSDGFSAEWDAIPDNQELYYGKLSIEGVMRASRNSGFFNPENALENSQKKTNLINQRNSMAGNINDFNRQQKNVHPKTSSLVEDASEGINGFNKRQGESAYNVLEVIERINKSKDLNFFYLKDGPENVTLPNNRNLTFQKVTYFYGGNVVAILGEVLDGRDGSFSIRNTYKIEYDSPYEDSQTANYFSITYNLNTGMVTESEWSDGRYWTEDDVDNDDMGDSEVTSGHRVETKLAAYKEDTTPYYPPTDDDPWTGDVNEWLKLNISRLESMTSEVELLRWIPMDLGEYEEGVTSKVIVSEIRYYTEDDEIANQSHIKDQMASYHEIRGSVEGRFSDAPDLVTEVDWYNANYGWAFKDEEDSELVFRVNESTEYIEDFKRTKTEIENKQSVSLITGYEEHSEDNIGHNTTRNWTIFIAGGPSENGTWNGNSGYDKYARVIEYKEVSMGVEGAKNDHGYYIEYWEWVELDKDNDTRTNFGQVECYVENSSFIGSYSTQSNVIRKDTYYDKFGRLKIYIESDDLNGVSNEIVYNVTMYRSEGWISNLVEEYFIVGDNNESWATDVYHKNFEWDSLGQQLAYSEKSASEMEPYQIETIVTRLNKYNNESYLLDGYQELVYDAGERDGAAETEYTTVTYNERYNMQYNSRNQMVSYDRLSVNGLTESFWTDVTDNGSNYDDLEDLAFGFSLDDDMDTITSAFDFTFDVWGLVALSERSNIDYNERILMTDYEEDLWQFGEIIVDVPILDENGEVVVDDTGEIQTQTVNQSVNVLSQKKWFDALYDDLGRLVNYNSNQQTSLMPDINTYTELRNGSYDQFGRQIGFNETTLISGNYLDNGIEKEIYAQSSRKRHPDYTSYDKFGRLFSYRDQITDAMGAQTEVWHQDTHYNIQDLVLGYTQELIHPDYQRTRTTVKEHVYDTFGRLVNYQEEIYDFTDNGDLKSSTTINPTSTLFNGMGQVVFESEVSEAFSGSSAILDNEFTTYRATESPLDWLLGTKEEEYEVMFANGSKEVYRVSQVDEDGDIIRYERFDYDEEGDWASGSVIDHVHTEINDSGEKEVQFEIARNYDVHPEDGIRDFRLREGIPSELTEVVNSYLNSLELYARDTGRQTRVWWAEGFELANPEELNTGYNPLGKVNSYHEEVYTDKGTFKLERSGITYDTQGFIESYNETGIKDDSDYQFERSNIGYDSLGNVIKYTEKGERQESSGGKFKSYQLDRDNMVYGAGFLTAYYEEGLSEEGKSYAFYRSDIDYYGGSMVGYRENGALVGEEYEYTRWNISYDASDRIKSFMEEGVGEQGDYYTLSRTDIEYSGDSLAGFKESGERNHDTYEFNRFNITYEGENITSYEEEGIDSQGNNYNFNRSEIGYDWFTGSVIEYSENGMRNGGVYGLIRLNITYDGASRIVYFQEEGTDNRDLRYRFERTYGEFIEDNTFSYTEIGFRNITDDNPEGWAYSMKLEVTQFEEEGGTVTIFENPTEDGFARRVLTNYYVVKDRNKFYVDGELRFYELDGNNVVQTDCYELFYDLVEGVDEPKSFEDYDVSVVRRETTEVMKDDDGNYGFDRFGNAHLTETKEYIINEGKDGLEENETLDSLMVFDFTNIERALVDNSDEFEYIGGSYTEIHDFDSDGNPLDSETYNYVIDEDSSGNMRKLFTKGELVNNEYDLQGNVINKTTLSYKLVLDEGLDGIDVNDSFDEVTDQTERRYEDISITKYEDFNDSKPTKETNEYYRILRSVLESEDPESMLRLYDNGTGTRSKINTKVVGMDEPEGVPEVAELEYGALSLKSNFNYRGSAREEEGYNYYYNDTGSREYISGQMIENSYDTSGRIMESITLVFGLEYNESKVPGSEEYSDYYVTFEYLEVKEILSYDRSGKYPKETETRGYDLLNSSNFSWDFINDFFMKIDSEWNETYPDSLLLFKSLEETYYGDYDYLGNAGFIETRNYNIEDGMDAFTYTNGSFIIKTFDKYSRLIRSLEYRLEFYLNESINGEGNPVPPEPVDGEYSDEDYIVMIDRLLTYEVQKDSEGDYLFDVYDVPIEVETHEYIVNSDNRDLLGIVTLKDYRTASNGDLTTILETKFSAVHNMVKLRMIIDTLPNDELSKKLKNSLISKIDNVIKSIEKENYIAARNRIGAFINEVEAQRGKKITQDTADMLIGYADFTIPLIGRY